LNNNFRKRWNFLWQRQQPSFPVQAVALIVISVVRGNKIKGEI